MENFNIKSNYAFSLALNEELKDTTVSVNVLCPGSVVTNDDGLNRIKSMGWSAKILIEETGFVVKKLLRVC